MTPTPLRNVRISDELWEALREKADAEGMDASTVVRYLIQMWLEG